MHCLNHGLYRQGVASGILSLAPPIKISLFKDFGILYGPAPPNFELAPHDIDQLATLLSTGKNKKVHTFETGPQRVTGANLVHFLI